MAAGRTPAGRLTIIVCVLTHRTRRGSLAVTYAVCELLVNYLFDKRRHFNWHCKNGF